MQVRSMLTSYSHHHIFSRKNSGISAVEPSPNSTRYNQVFASSRARSPSERDTLRIPQTDPNSPGCHCTGALFLTRIVSPQVNTGLFVICSVTMVYHPDSSHLECVHEEPVRAGQDDSKPCEGHPSARPLAARTRFLPESTLHLVIQSVVALGQPLWRCPSDQL